MTQNRLSRMISQVDRVPGVFRTRLRSFAIGRFVRFVGTAGLRIEELSSLRAVVVVPNHRAVQNHLGSVHAAAMALVAETATGFLVGMNVPDDRVPVIKSLKVNFHKRAKGSLKAVAELTTEQQHSILSTEKGEVTPRVVVTDGEGKEPITCEMVWAWTPRRR